MFFRSTSAHFKIKLDFFCQQFIYSLLYATPLPPHLQASRDLGLTRQLWRGSYWLSALAASHPFFQLCFETQSKFKKKKNLKKIRHSCSPYSHQQRSHRHSLKHGCKMSSTGQAGKCSARKKVTLRKGTDFRRGRGKNQGKEGQEGLGLLSPTFNSIRF